MLKVSMNQGRSQCVRGLAAVAALATVTAGASAAEALVSVNDGSFIAVPLNQGASLGGGDTWSGSYSVAGEWSVLVNLTVEGDLSGERSVFGILETVNHGSEPKFFELNLSFPVCESLHGPSVISAATRLQLTANANGGFIRVPGGEHGLRCLHDGAYAAHAYNGPFFVTASGAGTATVFGNFSQSDAPALVSDHGLRLRYELSDGDTARLLVTKIGTRAEDDADVSDCAPGEGQPEDLNGDGLVNVQDLIIMLSSWGACAGCPADLDGNGFVDFRDVILLFAAWD